MTDKQKILQFIDLKGISKNKFYIKTGFSVGFLDSGSSLGVDKLRIIIDKYHDFNVDWFLFDRGEPIKTKSIENTTILNGGENGGENGDKLKIKDLPPFQNDNIPSDIQKSEYNKVMQKLKFVEGIDITDHGAPFYNLPVSAGKAHELIDMAEIPTGYINMPGVNCDAYFPITGASFEPYIRAGDIIGINFIDKWENLDPDCVYLIITYDQRMLKRLMKHPSDSTLLICISPNYKEFNIDKFTIRYIHKVTFCGRPV